MQEFMLEQAEGSRDVIRRFGRYPHRNDVLGRTSVPEELESILVPRLRFICVGRPSSTIVTLIGFWEGVFF
jgi:hypothetical protein